MSYNPTETHLELYPDTDSLIKCKCGVFFKPRTQNAQGDSPKKCLPCNRKSWSKLFAHHSVSVEQAEVVPIRGKVRHK